MRSSTWVVRLSMLLRQWYCYCDRTQHGCQRLHCEINTDAETMVLLLWQDTAWLSQASLWDYHCCWENGIATMTGYSMQLVVTGFTDEWVVRLSLLLREWYCYCDRMQHGCHRIHWWMSIHVVLVTETMVLSLWLAQRPNFCFLLNFFRTVIACWLMLLSWL